MWLASTNRRELLDILLSGKGLSKISLQDNFHLDELSILDRDANVVWMEEPKLGENLPSLIVIDDVERDSFFAQINSHAGGPSPITAYSRVISSREARLLFSQKKTAGQTAIINGLVGLSYCEAIVHAGGTLTASELNPAICKRTVAYAWAKALANDIPYELLITLVENWFEALRISSGSERVSAMTFAIESATPIFETVIALYFKNSASDPIVSLCEAIIDDDEISLHKSWDRLSTRLEKHISLSEISSLAREDRGAYLQFALRSLELSGDWRDAALCAFLATRISPGTFEHLEFLMNEGGAKTAMWYSFLSALKKPRGELGFAGGLGSRVIRDIFLRESIKERPKADIALSELHVLARGGLESLAKRLGQVNSVEIEVVPLVTCSFRFHSKKSRQAELFDKGDANGAISNKQTLEDEPVKMQIESIIRALEKLQKAIPESSSGQFKTTPRRTRKTK